VDGEQCYHGGQLILQLNELSGVRGHGGRLPHRGPPVRIKRGRWGDLLHFSNECIFCGLVDVEDRGFLSSEEDHHAPIYIHYPSICTYIHVIFTMPHLCAVAHICVISHLCAIRTYAKKIP
jgi:hypothetical protein